MADPTFTPKVYKTNNGDRQVVASGGEIDIESGGAFKIAGVDKTAQLSAALAGLAVGKKIAFGEVTLDGANPTPIVTGLAVVETCVVIAKRSTAPGLDPTHFTVDYGGGVAAGTVNVYAWKPTAANDGTLIASTNNSAVLSYIALGS